MASLTIAMQALPAAAAIASRAKTSSLASRRAPRARVRHQSLEYIALKFKYVDFGSALMSSIMLFAQASVVKTLAIATPISPAERSERGEFDSLLLCLDIVIHNIAFALVF